MSNRAFFGLIRGELDMLDGRWSNALTAQFVAAHRTGYDVANPFATPTGQPIVPAYGDKGRRLKGSYEGAFQFGTDEIKHRVTFALDAERESSRSTISLFGGALDRLTRTNIGIVGQYDVTISDRFALGASLRHDENNRFADPNTYRVQASYEFEEELRIHAAAGSGIKAPDFSDLFDFFTGRSIGNPDLQPEKSKGWEVGLEQSFASDTVTIGATCSTII